MSSGQTMLCDLQGGPTASGAVISDPVIMSARQSFGVTDLGPKGIRNFFARHRCNQFCKSSWTKPRDAKVFYAAVESSTMEERRTAEPSIGRIGFVGLATLASVADSEDEYYSDDDGAPRHTGSGAVRVLRTACGPLRPWRGRPQQSTSHSSYSMQTESRVEHAGDRRGRMDVAGFLRGCLEQ
eukprot:518856-Prymnesium_polylepis.1